MLIKSLIILIIKTANTAKIGLYGPTASHYLVKMRSEKNDSLFYNQKTEVRKCRHKIFLYNLSGTELWDVDKDPKVNLTKYTSLWGKYQDWLYSQSSGTSPEEGSIIGVIRNTNQWIAALMMYDRVKRSKCLVYNPEDADMFYIPAFADPKENHAWRYRCDINESTFLNAIPHITFENACRHFIFIAKTHRTCSTGSWYFEPNDSRLRAMIRLAYDEPLTQYSSSLKSQNFELYPDFFRSEDRGFTDRCHGGANSRSKSERHQVYEDCMVSWPHVYSVPYPSSIHFENISSNEGGLQQKSFHSKSALHRDIFMIFVGHIVKGKASNLREKLHLMGLSYGDNHTYFKPDPVSVREYGSWFQRSVFCLQPGGDSPGRKSISDAITQGCIPVLFGNVSAAQYAWFYPPETHIDIDLDMFMNGEIDIKTHLESIPKSYIARIQQKLALVSKSFTYNYDEEIGYGDAIYHILDLVATHAASPLCNSEY